MKKLFLGVILALFMFAGAAFAFEIELTWDPNTESDLAGYKLYAGTTSENYVTIVDIGPIQQSADGKCHYVTDQNFVNGITYFMVITAYDNETPSLESGFSNEVMTDGLSGFPPNAPGALGIQIIININVN